MRIDIGASHVAVNGLSLLSSAIEIGLSDHLSVEDHPHYYRTETLRRRVSRHLAEERPNCINDDRWRHVE